jgi:hypothetical protein
MVRDKMVLAVFFALLLVPVVMARDDVSVGVYVVNLGKFDVSTGSFTADFYLSMACPEECDPSGFEFMNGRAATMDKIIDEPDEKFYRIQANLNSPIDLKKFPFDQQKIGLIIEDKTKTTTELRYIADEGASGMDGSVAIAGWNLDGWDVRTLRHEYPIYNETYSQFIFSIDISRIALSSFMKTFLPVFFIMLIVLFSFLMDPDKIATRLGMVGSALVASVMFHVSISNQIPAVGYLTFADKFMVLTYFILLGSFVMNILMLELSEQKKAKLVESIHRRTEYSVFLIVPLLYVLLFLFA